MTYGLQNDSILNSSKFFHVIDGLVLDLDYVCLTALTFQFDQSKYIATYMV